MKVILQVSEIDTSVVGLTNDMNVAESIIVDAFKNVRLGEEELVKIECDGIPLYTGRARASIEEDDFEYVDNDGNPINADGSEKTCNTSEDENPVFDYSSEYMWLIKEAEEDKTIDVSASEYFLPDTHTLFEGHENVVVPTV